MKGAKRVRRHTAVPAKRVRRHTAVPVIGHGKNAPEIGNGGGIFDPDFASGLDRIGAGCLIVEVAHNLGERPFCWRAKVAQHARGISGIAAFAQGLDHGVDRGLGGRHAPQFGHGKPTNEGIFAPSLRNDFSQEIRRVRRRRSSGSSLDIGNPDGLKRRCDLFVQPGTEPRVVVGS